MATNEPDPKGDSGAYQGPTDAEDERLGSVYVGDAHQGPSTTAEISEADAQARRER